MIAARVLHALALDALNLLTAPARAAAAHIDARMCRWANDTGDDA
jgi:hypothetical protein